VAIPSRAVWLQSLRRLGWVGATWVGYVVVHLIADWAHRRFDWTWSFRVLWPIEMAVQLGLMTGILWTLGSLVVASISAARRPFRSVRVAIARTVKTHARFTTQAMPWAPGLVAVLVSTQATGFDRPWLAEHLVGVVIVLLSSYAIFRGLMRRLVDAPLESSAEDDDGVDGVDTASPSDSQFAALAVTRVTRGLVGTTLLASIAMLLAAWLMPTPWLWHRFGLGVLLAYASVVLALPVWLRRSRILVGIDGVLVLGSGSPRFHAYANHDEVRQDGEDIVLLRQGRAALRLQLDDADRRRAPKLVLRLRAAMSLAAKMSREGADHLVKSLEHVGGAPLALATSARGAVDYRKPAVVREQLWALVEGPLCDGDTRLVAAGALVHDLREGDRSRLRVAAISCAEPRVRVALDKLAGPIVETEEEEPESESLSSLRAIPRRSGG
jgi:hypothetical protein